MFIYISYKHRDIKKIFGILNMVNRFNYHFEKKNSTEQVPQLQLI